MREGTNGIVADRQYHNVYYDTIGIAAGLYGLMLAGSRVVVVAPGAPQKRGGIGDG